MGILQAYARRLAPKRSVAKLNAKLLPTIDRAVARLTGGRHTLTERVAPTLLLTTTGRRSGEPRTSPLLYVPHGEGWAVVGTNFGQEHHPAWTHNLLADPVATVTLGGRQVRVRARRVTDEELAALWPGFVEIYPGYADYRERLERDARMFALEPVST